ncbi:MBL fold metallo-hydrolase [Ectothiorhodosinus mongolicus]|nr:MBL fold metallo-hydrolase [Ectothiorhodosinus mongolicus]ULX56758.1 hypothetical protein CKX93_02945 [Ectothiorhodosinus mongolicus]
MMNQHRLLALPVLGESFLLQRDGKNILVDGGFSSSRLIRALQATNVDVNQLDIVVCTHADRDHAGGLKNLLGNSTVSVGEIWLPGEWGDSLRELLNDPKAVVDALVNEFREFEPPRLNDSPADSGDSDEVERQAYAIINSLREKRMKNYKHDVQFVEGEETGLSGLQWLQEIAGNTQQKDANLQDERHIQNRKAAENIFQNGINRIRYRQAKRRLDAIWAKIWIVAIHAAAIIRGIALQAIESNVRVRWFDFDRFVQNGYHPVGGVADLLTPLNAVEIPMPPTPASDLRYFVRLTPVNERSLAFLSTQAAGLCPTDIVFTGDSPLGYGVGYKMSFLARRTQRGLAIVTAPHHGSESNAVAYTHIRSCWQDLLWLRSGGTRKHPGATFKKIPTHLRACTHCPQKGKALDLAEVQLSDRLWPVLRVRSHYCDCEA